MRPDKHSASDLYALLTTATGRISKINWPRNSDSHAAAMIVADPANVRAMPMPLT